MTMGPPKGNKNATKGKPWEEALRKALARAGGSIAEGLAPIADKVVAAAQAGDAQSIKEIGDRLDGKAKQAVDLGLSDDPENGIHKLVPDAEAVRAKIRSGQ